MGSKLEFRKEKWYWDVFSEKEHLGTIVKYKNDVSFDPHEIEDSLSISELRQIADFCEQQNKTLPTSAAERERKEL